jgi:hypothetical protein
VVGCFVRIFQKSSATPSIPLIEMGRVLPLVVVNSRSGILAEKPRLRINNTSYTRGFFFFFLSSSSLRYDFYYTAILFDGGEVTVQKRELETGMMKLYEKEQIIVLSCMYSNSKFYYVSARGVGGSG